MAVNKRKVLEAARKYAQKGAKEKALKEYNTLLKLDPRDAKLHLEIGDAHRRWGQMDEAVTQYTRVADQYKQDGFDARAVAVYKQILNIDSKRYTAQIALADVYQRMGLEAEALNALQAAADGYRQEGNKREALELLRKMAQLDPGNTTSRLKVAELLQQEGLDDDAVAEYEAVLVELERQGGGEQLPSVYERILELRPGRSELLVKLAKHWVTEGEHERAEPFATRAVEHDPSDADRHELVCDIYRELDRASELESATRALANLYRERGDDQTARQIMQRLPSGGDYEFESGAGPEAAAAPAADATPVDVGPGAEAALGEDDLLEDDDFLAGDDDDFDEVDEEDDDGEPTIAPPPPQGDPDQLFAEASVYLRYGKRDQAISSLEAILLQEPGHREALEKLGEAHADGGDDASAIEAWSRAASLARDAGDADGFDILHGRISALDEDAAAALGPAPLQAGADAGEGDLDFEGPGDAAGFDLDEDFELDVDLDVGADEVAEPPAAAEAAAEPSFGLEDVEFTDDVAFEAPASEPLRADASPEPSKDDVFAAGLDADDGLDIDIGVDLDVDVDEADFDLGEDGASSASDDPAGASPGSLSLSSASALEIQDELEEAEFYFEQDLFEDAERLYRRVLEKAPQHPSAMLRIGEIEAQRGGDPDQTGAQPALEEAGFESGEEPAVEDGLVEFDFADDVDGLVQSADADAADENDEPDDLAAAMEAAAASLEADEIADEDPSEGALDAAEESFAPVGETRIGEDTTEVVDAADLADEGPSGGFAEVTQPVVMDADDFDAAVEDPDDSGFGDETDTLEVSGTSELSDALEEADAAFAQVPDANEGAVEAGSIEADEVEHSPAVEDAVAQDDAGSQADADAHEDASFDLGAELRDSLAEEDEQEEASSSAASTSDDGFASIFNDFKKGVSETLSEGDYETRYDLGIAYREMELYDDAIGEFRLCLESPPRRFESLHMMGLCALDLERVADAVSHLEQALSMEDVSEEKRTGVEFDLARAYATHGDAARARAAFESVQRAEPDFPGIGAALAALGAADDAGSGDGAAEPEVFESFDDVVAEAEAADEAPEAGEAAAVPDAPNGESGGDKPRRKKKISFV